MDTDKVYSQVQEHYSSIARAKEPKYGSAVERSIGYTEEELKCMPQYANLGVSCGNPLATASLREECCAIVSIVFS